MGRYSAGPWYRKSEDTYYATIGGKPRSLGVKGRHNEAAAWAEYYRRTTGSPLPPAHSAQRPAVAFDTVVARFLTRCEARVAVGQMDASTLEVYRRMLRHAAKKFGGFAAAALDPDELTVWAAGNKRWSWSYQNAILSICVTALRWACRPKVGLVASNPLDGIEKPPRQSRGAKCVLSPEQLAKVLAAAPASLADLLRLMWLTGMRPSEACRATAADYDRASGTIRLAKHKTARKTGRDRVVYLSPAAVELVERLAARRPSGPLLRNARGEPVQVRSAMTTLRRVGKKTGVRTCLYAARHNYLTNLLISGVPDAIVAELAGHTSTNMIHMHYSHIEQNSHVLRAAVAKGPTLP